MFNENQLVASELLVYGIHSLLQALPLSKVLIGQWLGQCITTDHEIIHRLELLEDGNCSQVATQLKDALVALPA